jgi:hypothetical protein
MNPCNLAVMEAHTMRHVVILGLSMATVNVGCVADPLTSEHRVALKEAPSVEFIHR